MRSASGTCWPRWRRPTCRRSSTRCCASGRDRFRDGPLPPAAPDLQILRAAKDRERVIRRNAGASLVDLGDGVLAVEFHSKMNAIGGDTVAMLDAGVKEAEANFAALVIGNDAPDFSVGANLMLVLLEAQEGNWDEIDLMVRALQRTTRSLRYAAVPVVVCPAGMTLGGGCEVLLHGDRAQAAAEAYIGLVEVGVGLIPAGGGTKEMLARATAEFDPGRDDLLKVVQPVFETIGFGKVSTSAADARRLGFLTAVDGTTMNRERLMSDAKPSRWRASATAIVHRRAERRFPSAATRCWRRSISASTWPGVPGGSAITMRLSAERWPGFWPAARCRTRATSAKSTFWIWSARRSCGCAASARRSSAFNTRLKTGKTLRN